MTGRRGTRGDGGSVEGGDTLGGVTHGVRGGSARRSGAAGETAVLALAAAPQDVPVGETAAGRAGLPGLGVRGGRLRFPVAWRTKGRLSASMVVSGELPSAATRVQSARRCRPGYQGSRRRPRPVKGSPRAVSRAAWRCDCTRAGLSGFLSATCGAFWR